MLIITNEHKYAMQIRKNLECVLQRNNFVFNLIVLIAKRNELNKIADAVNALINYFPK